MEEEGRTVLLAHLPTQQCTSCRMIYRVSKMVDAHFGKVLQFEDVQCVLIDLDWNILQPNQLSGGD